MVAFRLHGNRIKRAQYFSPIFNTLCPCVISYTYTTHGHTDAWTDGQRQRLLRRLRMVTGMIICCYT